MILPFCRIAGNRDEVFCLNPWHFERSDPAILALTTAAAAAPRRPHQCDVRLRIGAAATATGGGEDGYVCPICQANKVHPEGRFLVYRSGSFLGRVDFRGQIQFCHFKRSCK